jgi:signal transduction histidine kinase
MQTSIQLESEVTEQLGFLPSFLLPAIETPEIFTSLFQQTLLAYINNPLPALFKEKLFVNLSRYCEIDYFTICHSCTLRSLGSTAQEILILKNIEIPQTESDLEADLQLLERQLIQKADWENNSEIETSLLRCSLWIFLQPSATANCALKLQQFLGSLNYSYLLVFLGYIKLCHQWLRNNPEICYEEDRRAQLHLAPLLMEEIELAEFFKSNQSHLKLNNSEPVKPVAVIGSTATKCDCALKPPSNRQLVFKLDKETKETLSRSLSSRSDGNQLTILLDKNVTNFINYESDESKLAEVEARLKVVIEATKTGNWDWNIANNRVDICHRGRAILGLTDFDNSYQGFLQSIHSSERESVDLAAVRAVKTAEDLNLEYRIVKPDDEICWIRTKGKLSCDLSGKVIHLSGVITDISDEKQAIEKIKNSNQAKPRKVTQSLNELENLLNSIPYYLFVVDVNTHCISVCNLGLAQSLGFSNSQQLQGKPISECFPTENAHHITWQHQEVLIYKEVLRTQEKVILPDGTHYFDTVITPLKNADGEIYALLHTSSDIPDLAAAQEALSQRTLQLEAANKELESFSYSVSHDLQAPLRVINGFSQVLWENYQPYLDDRGKHYLQRIQANSQRMSDLIDALLQLSRVTRSQMQSTEVNLSAIATEIIEELQAEHTERQVELKIAPQIMAQGDPRLLQIALKNLLENAWKYTSKRSLAEIEFNVISGDNGQLTYFVRDNGAGFDLEYADKLFTAFKRLHTETEFPGTGIGLATVKRIIYRHGGKVWAEGEYDLGATFYFSL